MSCYLRHLKDLIAEAGIEISPANKKQIDSMIHQFVGVVYKDCPTTWKRLKSDFVSDAGKRMELVESLRRSGL